MRDFLPANELRYISIADEALANGQIFAFTNQGMPYADKPPLYMWLVIISRWIAGDNCLWLISLFSLIPAVVIVLVMNKWSASLLPAPFRPMAAMLLLTCGLFTGMMVTLRMDMLMTMWIVLALYEFYKWTKEDNPSGRTKWLFPIYVFLAIFTKGPMGFLIPLVGTAVYLFVIGELKSWFRYWNWRTWLLLLGLCAIWFSGVYLDGGKEYLDNLLFHQTMDRAVNSFHHKRPFHYYFTSMWYTFMPWAFLVLGSVIVALIKRKTEIRSDIERFYLSIGVTTIVMLSFVSGKLQVYLLPAYPFFVYYAAIFISRHEKSKWLKIAIAVPAAILSVAIAAIWVAGDMVKLMPWMSPILYVVVAIVSLSGLVSLVLLWWRGGSVRISVMTLGYGLMLAVLVGAFAVSDMNPYIGYGNVCERVKPLIEQNPRTEVYTWRVRRSENMDAYLGRDVTVVDAAKRGENGERLATFRKGSLLIVPVEYKNDPYVRLGGYERLQTVGNHLILEKK